MPLDNDQRLYLSERWVPENSFWKFALTQWRHPLLRESLLAAQDKHGLRISLFLFSAWLATNKRQLDYEALLADQSLSAWQTGLVDMLRHCRKQLSGSGGNYEKMKSSLQSTELLAEQWEMSQLYHHHRSFSNPVDKSVAEVLLWNLLSYTEGDSQNIDKPERELMSTIVDISKGFLGSLGIEMEQITLDEWASHL